MCAVGAQHTGTAAAASLHQTASKTLAWMLSFKIQSQKHSHLFSFHYECTCTLRRSQQLHMARFAEVLGSERCLEEPRIHQFLSVLKEMVYAKYF